ncbi:MAG TPA: LytTR family DNA-binding domain-containing protein, partial [Bacteroidales bacterium]|nr:LytTR family DNA-binding domain-containing protein [Bacteroidales bacterium]
MEIIPEKITAVIIDDEVSAIELLEAILLSIGGVEVLDRCRNLDSSLKSIIRFNPEIVFLDILLEGENGFDLVNDLHPYDVNPTIIFVTGHDEFILDAIRHAAFDYLQKPVDPDELRKTLSRYRQKISGPFKEKAVKLRSWLEETHKIRFNTSSGFILINPVEIIYLQADANYTDVYLVDERKHTISKNIGEIEKILGKNPVFFRISRSVIININYLS